MQPTIAFPPPELSERQAARYVGLSYETFRRLRLKGHVKPTHVYPIGGRRYSVDDLQAFADRYRVRRRA